MPSATSPLVGISLKITSALVFTVMGLLIKLVGERFPTGEIVFFRSAFALIPLSIYLAWRHDLRRAFRTSRLSGHLLRSSIGVLAMSLNFAGIALLPLADATAIFYAAPIFVVVFAAILLKERVRAYRWSAVIVGFIGVLLTLTPHLSGEAFGSRTSIGALTTLAAATFAAVAMIQVRRLTETESTGSIVLYFTLFSTLFGFLSLFVGPLIGMPWALPSALDLLILCGIGILGGIAQILLTQSYRFGDASLIAPFEYSSMLFALGLGYFVFGDVPAPLVIVGAVIIIGAGLFVIYRERQLGLVREGGVRAG
ncbi:MAG: DMT family transporter [Labrys sp. (in: a-proteobacteria)]